MKKIVMVAVIAMIMTGAAYAQTYGDIHRYGGNNNDRYHFRWFAQLTESINLANNSWALHLSSSINNFFQSEGKVRVPVRSGSTMDNHIIELISVAYYGLRPIAGDSVSISFQLISRTEFNRLSNNPPRSGYLFTDRNTYTIVFFFYKMEDGEVSFVETELWMRRPNR